MGPEVLQKKFEAELLELKKSQKAISKSSMTRGELDAQFNENKLVKDEMDLLTEDAVVYKLIGPALIRQDREDANQNVAKRIEYISLEIKRHEDNIKKLETEQESRRESLTKLQNQLQQMMVKAAAQQK